MASFTIAPLPHAIKLFDPLKFIQELYFKLSPLKEGLLLLNVPLLIKPEESITILGLKY